jgi:hypothetical protein
LVGEKRTSVDKLRRGGCALFIGATSARSMVVSLRFVGAFFTGCLATECLRRGAFALVSVRTPFRVRRFLGLGTTTLLSCLRSARAHNVGVIW